MSTKGPSETPDLKTSIREQLEAIAKAANMKDVDFDSLAASFAQKAEQAGLSQVRVGLEFGATPEAPLVFVLKDSRIFPEPPKATDFGWAGDPVKMDALTYHTLLTRALNDQGASEALGRFRPSVRVDDGIVHDEFRAGEAREGMMKKELHKPKND